MRCSVAVYEKEIWTYSTSKKKSVKKEQLYTILSTSDPTSFEGDVSTLIKHISTNEDSTNFKPVSFMMLEGSFHVSQSFHMYSEYLFRINRLLHIESFHTYLTADLSSFYVPGITGNTMSNEKALMTYIVEVAMQIATFFILLFTVQYCIGR